MGSLILVLYVFWGREGRAGNASKCLKFGGQRNSIKASKYQFLGLKGNWGHWITGFAGSVGTQGY